MWLRDKRAFFKRRGTADGADFSSVFHVRVTRICEMNPKLLLKFFPFLTALVLPSLGRSNPINTFTCSATTQDGKARGSKELPAKSGKSFKTVRLEAKPVSSCHSTGNSYSPGLFLFKVPAVTKYTKNYLAASPSSSITV